MEYLVFVYLQTLLSTFIQEILQNCNFVPIGMSHRMS